MDSLNLLYRLRQIIKYVLTGLVGLIVFSFGSYHYIDQTYDDQIATSPREIKSPKCILVLGASKKIGSYNNLYFVNRMQATADLYHAGKAQHIIVSGDNHVSTYNEPQDMADYLVELGVPRERITLDYAGFRTFDSIERCKKVFQQDDIIIVSQSFHLKRALFLADNLGVKAVGYAAKDVYRRQPREYLARSKAILDIYLLNTRSKFLGPKIDI